MVGVDLRFECFWCVECDDLVVVYDRDVIAELGFVYVVCGYEDCDFFVFF